MAASLMNQFISEKHGVKDQDWTEQMALSLDSDLTEFGLIKALIIEVNDETFTYYFDLSRPMRNPFLTMLQEGGFCHFSSFNRV
jgi:hypothetical protein